MLQPRVACFFNWIKIYLSHCMISWIKKYDQMLPLSLIFLSTTIVKMHQRYFMSVYKFDIICSKTHQIWKNCLLLVLQIKKFKKLFIHVIHVLCSIRSLFLFFSFWLLACKKFSGPVKILSYSTSPVVLWIFSQNSSPVLPYHLGFMQPPAFPVSRFSPSPPLPPPQPHPHHTLFEQVGPAYW